MLGHFTVTFAGSLTAPAKQRSQIEMLRALSCPGGIVEEQRQKSSPKMEKDTKNESEVRRPQCSHQNRDSNVVRNFTPSNRTELITRLDAI